MPIPKNCTRSSAGVLPVVVLVGFLSLVLNGWANSTAGADVPAIKPPTHPLSIAKEVALANDYLFGRGVAQDPKQSAYWLEKAANAGNPEAQIEMGYFYETGIGVARSMELAAHWYQLAAHGGVAEAKASLGMLYFWGMGVSENRETAAQLFREAAEKGVGMAAYELGIMYSIGTGVPQDKATAEQWYMKGAKQHNPQAEYQLGLLFSNATDHKLDLHKAENLLRSSAASGFVPAMHTLGLLLSRHPDLAKFPGEAAQFLEDSANAGIWKSSEVLGVLARDGNGVPKDDKAAYFHFRVAALQGGNEAQKSVDVDLQRLTAKLEPALTSTLDTAAQAWYQKHQLVLEFVYKKDGRATYPVSAFAAPKGGEHELQLLSAVPNELSDDRGVQTAKATVK